MRIRVLALVSLCVLAGLAAAAPRPRPTAPKPPKPPTPDTIFAAAVAERDTCLADAAATVTCQHRTSLPALEAQCAALEQACRTAAEQRLTAAGLGVPTITSPMPTTIDAGQPLTLQGTHLRVSRLPLVAELSGIEGIDYHLRTIAVPVTVTSDTQLTIRIPADAPTGSLRLATAWGPLIDARPYVRYPPITPAPVWDTVVPSAIPGDCLLSIRGTGFEDGDEIGSFTAPPLTAVLGTAGDLGFYTDHWSPPRQKVIATIYRRDHGAIHAAQVIATITVTDGVWGVADPNYGDTTPGGFVTIALTAPVAPTCGYATPGWSMTMVAPGGVTSTRTGPVAAADGLGVCKFTNTGRTQISCGFASDTPRGSAVVITLYSAYDDLTHAVAGPPNGSFSVTVH